VVLRAGAPINAMSDDDLRHIVIVVNRLADAACHSAPTRNTIAAASVRVGGAGRTSSRAQGRAVIRGDRALQVALGGAGVDRSVAAVGVPGKLVAAVVAYHADPAPTTVGVDRRAGRMRGQLCHAWARSGLQSEHFASWRRPSAATASRRRLGIAGKRQAVGG
jgi:hypothetical protein